MQNYDALVSRIVEVSGLETGEIEKKIEAKKAKLSGLISKEGAAQIVAAELNISFDNITLKISELMPGLKKVNVVGKIITLFPVRSYEKNGRSGRVANFVLADDTNNVRVVLWDDVHISLIEKGEINQGDVVEISNASMRESDLQLSGFSEIKKSSKVFDNVKTEKVCQEKAINEIVPGQSVKLRGIVVQMFNPRFFNVCSECGKKVQVEGDGFICPVHGKVQNKEKALINFVLDDGADSIRVVMFSDQINKLIPEEDLKDAEKLLFFRDDFLGTELWLSGDVRKNQLFNNVEMIAQGVEKVEVEKLINILESK